MQIVTRPRESIPILTEEVDELAFLFAVQVAANDDLALRLAGVNPHLLRLLRWLERCILLRVHHPGHSELRGLGQRHHLLDPLLSSAITRDSAKHEPAEAHSMERLWSPEMVIMPLGPGIFILR